MQTQTIPIADIIIGERQRIEYGDIETLADSLERYGLIQPVVLDDQNNLIAGGRRIAAAQRLEWTEIKCVYHGTLSEDERIELELEENVRRKDMSWQERVLGISKIHSLRSLDSMKAGQKWGYRETGELLGMTHSNIAYALWAANAIRAKDPAVLACSNMGDVIKVMLQRKEDAILKVMASEPTATVVTVTSDPQVEGSVVVTDVSVKLRAYHADSLSLLRGLTSPIADHCLSDPPYGIEMDNIQQENQGMDVSRTAAEHDVAENLHFLFNLIPLTFPAIRDGGFCVLWCDQDNWHELKRWGEAAGYRVQRWPLLWIKTDPCQNNAAQYNFTKRTEIAIVFRKPNATLNAVQPSNYFVGSGEDKKLFAHPFAKPRELWKWILNAISRPGQSILDPCAGSGTCPVACVEAGREPVAIEKVEVHYNELTENLKRAYCSVHGEGVRFE